MISINETRCPRCGGKLYYYDEVRRIIRTKGGKTNWIFLRRFKCEKCHKVHREIPSIIFPYKHYESEIIIGVREGIITSGTIGFEDYPCEQTITKWINH